MFQWFFRLNVLAVYVTRVSEPCASVGVLIFLGTTSGSVALYLATGVAHFSTAVPLGQLNLFTVPATVGFTVTTTVSSLVTALL